SRQLRRMLDPLLLDAVANGTSAADMCRALRSLLETPPEDPPEEVAFGSHSFAQLSFVELCSAVADMTYEELLNTAGDNGMVKRWNNLGFVVERRLQKAGGPDNLVYVETERSIYDGLPYRDYFHILMNIEKYPGFYDYSRQIVEYVLDKTQKLIDSNRIENEGI